MRGSVINLFYVLIFREFVFNLFILGEAVKKIRRGVDREINEFGVSLNIDLTHKNVDFYRFS